MHLGNGESFKLYTPVNYDRTILTNNDFLKSSTDLWTNPSQKMVGDNSTTLHVQTGGGNGRGNYNRQYIWSIQEVRIQRVCLVMKHPETRGNVCQMPGTLQNTFDNPFPFVSPPSQLNYTPVVTWRATNIHIAIRVLLDYNLVNDIVPFMRLGAYFGAGRVLFGFSILFGV